MVGQALDRAVTASINNVLPILGFWVIYSLVEMLVPAFWLRLGVTLTLYAAWGPFAAVIAAQSLGTKLDVTARRVGRLVMTVLCLWALLCPLFVVIVGAGMLIATVVIRDQPIASTVVALLAAILCAFFFARLLLGPMIAMIDDVAPRSAFQRSLELTRGKFMFSAMMLTFGQAATSLPFYAAYSVVLELFNLPLMHAAAISSDERIRISASIVHPFSLYSTLAACVVQIRLIAWLRAVRGVESEGSA